LSSVGKSFRGVGGEPAAIPPQGNSPFRIKALLLAAGLGTRLRPITDTIPKCLLAITGRPLLDYWGDRLAQAGIRDVLINTHALADEVRSHLGHMNVAGAVRFTEFHEPRLLGSAGTIAANPDYADDADAIVVIYADNLSDVDLRGLLSFHGFHPDPLTMVLFRAADPTACGIVELDAAARVLSFVEKPPVPRSDLANAGVYVFDAAAYREIARMGAFDLGFDVLPRFVGRMRGWLWEGYHQDIGTHESLERARREFPSRSEAVRTQTGPAPNE
jgi:NDP-sugar pyrophosphorylase family protein